MSTSSESAPSRADAERRVAIVTGAGSGIGLAAVRALARGGANVVLADVKRDDAAAACARIQDEFDVRALAVACDVSDEPAVVACVEQTLRTFARLDVIVNNAGLMLVKPLEEVTAEEFSRVLAVDLLGAFFFTKQAFLHMRAGGAIVNVSSVHAIETTTGVTPYAAAKAALLSLTRSAALEGKPKGLRVNAVMPGAIDTPMLWNNPNVRAGLEKIERKDVGTPEEVAAVIAFLASPAAGFVQSAVVAVDGGRLSEL